ncbi:unnamed protein product, partial [Owenia fusiformis]
MICLVLCMRSELCTMRLFYIGLILCLSTVVKSEDFVTPCNEGIPRTCTCKLADPSLPWEPVSDTCTKGCLHNIDYSEITWQEAMDFCRGKGGELVRWNIQQCYDDIEGWLNCKGYTDSKRFWSAGGIAVELDKVSKGKSDKMNWAAIADGQVQYFETDPTMGDVNITTLGKVVLHRKSNGVLVPENQPSQANKMFICQTQCDHLGPVLPPPPQGDALADDLEIRQNDIAANDRRPPQDELAADEPQSRQQVPVDCSINLNCPSSAPFCYGGACHICNVTNHDGCEDPEKPICKLNDVTNWLECGDPHFVESITGSDIPVCYTLFGRAGQHYKLLEYETTSITGTFADSKTPNLAHYLGALTITSGGDVIHFTGHHIEINGEEHEWEVAPSVGLERGNAEVIFINKRQVTFVSAVSGIEVAISRRGSEMGQNSRLDLTFTVPVNISGAKGIMGDMKSGTVTSKDDLKGTLTIADATANVHIDDVKYG